MQALGYRLDRTHQALIVWSREPEVNTDDLEVMVDRILLAAHGARALPIKAKASVVWLWLSDPVGIEDLSAIAEENFEIAAGQVLPGLAGFRDSHRTALITQQMMLKTKREENVVSYDQIKLAHLMLQQSDFSHVAAATLGKLFKAPEGIRESLRVYLAEGANAAQAAKKRGLHRNTLNRHLERANDLLPEPLHAGNRLQIGAVLDALSWG
ncbi:MAG: helix-turn-helix domain-containing protein [Pseudomonadota bacterium]